MFDPQSTLTRRVSRALIRFTLASHVHFCYEVFGPVLMKMDGRKCSALIRAGLVLILGNSISEASPFNLLHAFAGGPNDGDYPLGFLVVGDDLYGITQEGGCSDWASIGNGTIFSVKSDGSDYNVLHSFSARSNGSYVNADGYAPWAGFIFSGDTLYGTTGQVGRMPQAQYSR